MITVNLINNKTNQRNSGSEKWTLSIQYIRHVFDGVLYTPLILNAKKQRQFTVKTQVDSMDTKQPLTAYR